MNNGRRYSQKNKEEAKVLRKKGWTHREIGKKLGIAFSTAYYWTKGIILTSEQKKAIEERRNKHVWTEEERVKRGQLARVNFSRYWKKPYLNKELLNKIRKFYFKNGRIPLKREFNMYREYQQRFGSWNSAIRLAGFTPNPVMFSKKFVAKDGHVCDSFAEKIIDDWLFRYKIKHERNFPYSNRKMTADFTIGKVRIEYFGLRGLNKTYDQIIQIKRNICQKEGLKLLEIYPSDLFSKNFKNCLGKTLKTLKD
jgi:hypothetical protein